MTQATEPSTATRDLPRLLNVAEVADLLGVNVRHVRRLIHERRIPFIKWGHLIRFDPDEITRWIDHHRHGLAAPARPSPRRPARAVR